MPTEIDLNKMTNAQLDEFAKENFELDVTKLTTKAEKVAAIEKEAAATAEETTPEEEGEAPKNTPEDAGDPANESAEEDRSEDLNEESKEAEANEAPAEATDESGMGEERQTPIGLEKTKLAEPGEAEAPTTESKPINVKGATVISKQGVVHVMVGEK